MTWDVLARYVSGDVGHDERARVDAWRAAEPRQARLLEHVDAAWRQGLSPDGRTPDVETMSRAVAAAVRQRATRDTVSTVSTQRESRPSRRFMRPSWAGRSVAGWFVGGAVAIAAAIGLMHVRDRGATLLGTHEHRYATTRGERATILLPDGSSALLGYASTLIVPSDFGHTTRHVLVTGEAAFTVTPDRRAPFLVSVGDALTEVLGTSFVVQKYRTDAATRVAVTEGRVSLRLLETRNGHRALDSTAAVLVAGMMGQVSDSGRMTIAPASANESFADWTRGRLSFRATPLREVVSTLERVYDVDIEIADSALFDHHVTLAAMPDKTPITETLDLVTDVIGAHFTRSGRVFVIVPGKRATALPRTRTSPFTPETQYGR